MSVHRMATNPDQLPSIPVTLILKIIFLAVLLTVLQEATVNSHGKFHVLFLFNYISGSVSGSQASFVSNLIH